MEHNMLGITFIDPEMPSAYSAAIEGKMEEIIEKHKEAMNQEFDAYLEQVGCERRMGVVSERDPNPKTFIDIRTMEEKDSLSIVDIL